MRSASRRSIAQVLSFALIAAPAARADIAGEHVVSGDASFAQDGNVTTIHASDGAIIDYDRFSVLANEQLLFVQPSSDARVLNRVLGDASRIDGVLGANGIVYIVNPAGIFFGSSAVVNVGGLVAAAGSMSNEDFLARADHFTSLSGDVLNEGVIESPAVALLGSVVANHGHIHAPDGTIALVAGDRALLTRIGGHLAVFVEGPAGGADTAAIEQTGSVDAGAGGVSFTTGDVYSLAINHTGITRGREIELRAADGTVSVAGTLDASDHRAGATGGAISVTGERVALVDAQLDASGDAGGGTIDVSGRRTYVDDASSLVADAITSGDGGRALVAGDEAAAFYGAISARGGASSGDGGFAEISAPSLVARGDVDLRAPAGATGTLLYDPQEIEIVGGSPTSGDGSDAPDTSPGTVSGDGGTAGSVLFADVGTLATPFQIYESEIEGTNANVVLEATHRIDSTGTFDHIESGEATGVVRIRDGNSLTLRTRNDDGDEVGATNATAGIDLAGVSFETSGAGTITITTGTGSDTGAETGTRADIRVGDLTTAGRAVNVQTSDDGAITVGDVTTTGAAGAANGSGGGAVTIVARDADRSGDSDVTVGDIESSGGNGTTGAGGNGGVVQVRSLGAVLDIAGTATDPTLGGGDLHVGAIDTTGGTGATAGGAGGAVVLGGNVDSSTGAVSNPTDGAITVSGAIDASGGDGATGGNAGAISIGARDADRDGANDIHFRTITALGGAGTTSDGRGGAVGISTLESIEVRDADNAADNHLAEGGGDIDSSAAGPQIRSNGNLALFAGGSIGAASPSSRIEVEGAGLTTQGLTVSAGGTAEVRVTNAGFLDSLTAIARNTSADLHVEQAGDDGGNVIDLSGAGGDMVVHRVDTRDNQVDAVVQLINLNQTTTDGTLVLETESATTGVRAGGDLFVSSDGDLVVGNGDGFVIRSGQLDPGADPGTQLAPGAVTLVADASDTDGDGGLRDASGGAGGIDLLGDATSAGALNLYAGDGIGVANDPITIVGGGTLSAKNEPRTPTAPGSVEATELDDTATTGVFVRNTGSGDLVVATSADFPGALPGATVTAGTGGVSLTNEAGNLRVTGQLSAKPADSDDGAGGAISLEVQGANPTITLASAQPIASGGQQTYDGDVRVQRATTLTADGGVAITGRLDSDDASATNISDLTASLGDGTTFAVAGGVGTQRPLGTFLLESRLVGTDQGALHLDTPAVFTSAPQTYDSDLVVDHNTALTAAGPLAFAGDVSAPASLLLLTSADRILFTGVGDQSVSASALSLNTGVDESVSSVATIAKTGGNLSLASTGFLVIGDGEKLSVAGALSLTGSSGVRFTDLSALDITVTSPDIQVFARQPGLVTTQGDAAFGDGGTDLIANTIAFSTAPTVVGSGPAPRLATASGTAQNPGTLGVGTLPTPVTTAQIVSGSRVFDLAIPTLDPGHETQEIEPERIGPPLAVQRSQDRAGEAEPVSREEVAAFFACAPLGDAPAPDGCTPTAPPAYGSALDTERATDVAHAYRELLGDSPRATAGRQALARAAESKGDLGAAASPGGRVYLTDLARVLGQVRLLGLGARYPEVRKDVLESVARAIGSPQLDAARLGAAVDAHAMGMPI